LLLALTLIPRPAAVAENPGTPPAIQAVESGRLEALYAVEGGSPNLAGIYSDLKRLAKDYRKAHPDMKAGIAEKAEDLMGQLFDAKVQEQESRISALERRLQEERERLNSMQAHKRDLVHTATLKALDGRDLPEWARPSK
jgi:hypothetical protein